MKKNWYKLISFLILLPSAVFAEPAPAPSGAGIKDAFNVVKTVADSASGTGSGYDTSKNLDSVFGNIIALILSVLGIVFIIFIIYAGYLWMTASGNEEKTSKSKQIIKQSIIGLIVVVGAYAIAYFLLRIFSPQVGWI